MSTGGEVANALVCKTSIRRFNPDPVLHTPLNETPLVQARVTFDCSVKVTTTWRGARLARSEV